MRTDIHGDALSGGKLVEVPPRQGCRRIMTEESRWKMSDKAKSRLLLTASDEHHCISSKEEIQLNARFCRSGKGPEALDNL